MAPGTPRKRSHTPEQKKANRERQLQAISEKLNVQRTAEKTIHKGLSVMEAVMARRLHEKVLAKELTSEQAHRIKRMFDRKLAEAQTHGAGNAQELDLTLRRLANGKKEAKK